MNSLRIWNHHSSLVFAALGAAIVIAGCGGGSSLSTSASVATTGTTLTTQAKTTSTAQTTTPNTAAKSPGGAQSKSTKPANKPSSTATSTTATTPKKAPSTASKTGTTAKSSPTFGTITLASSAFKAGGSLSARYTCDGADLSPPLEWHGVPHGTAELFLLGIDLSGSSSDAIQWAVAGIPPNASGLSAGALPAGTVVGVNSAGKASWGGVCGAKGKLHHVAFLFYALSHKLRLKSGFNPTVARNGLKGATLGSGLMLATYQRP